MDFTTTIVKRSSTTVGTYRIDYIVNADSNNAITGVSAIIKKLTTTDGVTTEERVGNGNINVADTRMFYGIEKYNDVPAADRVALLTQMDADFVTILS